jgi:hypothetical protein
MKNICQRVSVCGGVWQRVATAVFQWELILKMACYKSGKQKQKSGKHKTESASRTGQLKSMSNILDVKICMCLSPKRHLLSCRFKQREKLARREI